MDTLYTPDLGDGRYQNPVLLADYADPDIIRVGDTYYLTASSFNYEPGLPILTSQDLVNWTLKGYALRAIPEFRGLPPQHARGVWAPAIRYHAGRFCIYYGMPDEGIYCVTADDPLGEWSAPVCVLPGKGLIDPCPFWDDDGQAYIVHGYAKSRIGFKSVLGIFPMRPDGLKAIGPDRILFDGQISQPTIEGPKVYKRQGDYYIFAPAGGVPTGWQTVLRSRSLHGPWAERIVLRQGSSPVNGPHQGAWVTAADGSEWFAHFQSRGLYGRILHLQPMQWTEDGWPFIGEKDLCPVPPETNATVPDRIAISPDCGIPVQTHKKPAAPASDRLSMQMSDAFDGNAPALQWQWMGSVAGKAFEMVPGGIRLYALPLPNAETKLWACPHALTQKVACLSFRAETTVNASDLRMGEQAGMAIIGGDYVALVIRRLGESLTLCRIESTNSADSSDSKTECVCPIAPAAQSTCLRLTLTNTGYDTAEATLSYRTADGDWQTAISGYAPSRHIWVGARIALVSMPFDGISHGGSAIFSALRVTALEVQP